MDLALKTLRDTMQLSTSIGDLHGVTLAMVGLAEFHISQGGHEQAGEYLELAQGRLKEEMYLPVSGLIQRLTGQLEASSGRLAEAKQHIAQSISIFTTTEIPFELARSYYEMGLLLGKAHDLKGRGRESPPGPARYLKVLARSLTWNKRNEHWPLTQRLRSCLRFGESHRLMTSCLCRDSSKRRRRENCWSRSWRPLSTRISAWVQ